MENKNKDSKNLMGDNDNLWKAIVSVLVIIAPGFYFGLLGKTTEMGIAVGAGIAAAFALHMNRVLRLKGFGVEAEMQKAVKEAYITIDRLQALAKPLIVFTFRMLASHNRYGGMEPHQKGKLARDITNLAKDFKFYDDKEIQNTVAEYHRYITWDHYSMFIRKVIEEFKLGRDFNTKVSATVNYSSDFPTGDDIKKLLGDVYANLSPNSMERLEDYLYYKDHKSLRREEALRETDNTE